MENGLCLTTVPRLFAVVTTLSLREQRGLASLVLRHLVLRVLAALLALAVGLAGLGDVDLYTHRETSPSAFLFIHICSGLILIALQLFVPLLPDA